MNERLEKLLEAIETDRSIKKEFFEKLEKNKNIEKEKVEAIFIALINRRIAKENVSEIWNNYQNKLQDLNNLFQNIDLSNTNDIIRLSNNLKDITELLKKYASVESYIRDILKTSEKFNLSNEIANKISRRTISNDLAESLFAQGLPIMQNLYKKQDKDQTAVIGSIYQSLNYLFEKTIPFQVVDKTRWLADKNEIIERVKTQAKQTPPPLPVQPQQTSAVEPTPEPTPVQPQQTSEVEPTPEPTSVQPQQTSEVEPTPEPTPVQPQQTSEVEPTPEPTPVQPQQTSEVEPTPESTPVQPQQTSEAEPTPEPTPVQPQQTSQVEQTPIVPSDGFRNKYRILIDKINNEIKILADIEKELNNYQQLINSGLEVASTKENFTNSQAIAKVHEQIILQTKIELSKLEFAEYKKNPFYYAKTDSELATAKINSEPLKPTDEINEFYNKNIDILNNYLKELFTIRKSQSKDEETIQNLERLIVAQKEFINRRLMKEAEFNKDFNLVEFLAHNKGKIITDPEIARNLNPNPSQPKDEELKNLVEKILEILNQQNSKSENLEESIKKCLDSLINDSNNLGVTKDSNNNYYLSNNPINIGELTINIGQQLNGQKADGKTSNNPLPPQDDSPTPPSPTPPSPDSRTQENDYFKDVNTIYKKIYEEYKEAAQNPKFKEHFVTFFFKKVEEFHNSNYISKKDEKYYLKDKVVNLHDCLNLLLRSKNEIIQNNNMINNNKALNSKFLKLKKADNLSDSYNQKVDTAKATIITASVRSEFAEYKDLQKPIIKEYFKKQLRKNHLHLSSEEPKEAEKKQDITSIVEKVKTKKTETSKGWTITVCDDKTDTPLYEIYFVSDLQYENDHSKSR